jgi:DNA modification methylase
MSLKAIKPNPDNPRTIKDDAFRKLVQSLQSFPEMLELRPIVVNADDVVLGGNMRLRAAKEAGLKDVPVIRAEHLTPEQQREFIVKDNVGFGAWDWDVLANEWDVAQLAAWGLDVFEVEQEATTGLTDADDVPELPKEPITKPGDRIVLGRHTLICGDCRDFATVETLLGGARINLAITSPPYASQRAYDESSGFKPIPADEYVKWYRDVAANIMAHLAEDGSYFCNIKEHSEDKQRHLYVKDLTIAHVREWGWRWVDEFCWLRAGIPGDPSKMGRFKNRWESVFWFATSERPKFRPESVQFESKDAFSYKDQKAAGKRIGAASQGHGQGKNDPVGRTLGMAYPSNVLDIQSGADALGHAAAYPVALPEFFVKAYTDEGDTVFDPFMGSGTTLIAAEKHGRVAFGCEISPAYCDVIVKRWEDFTGQHAVRPTA